MSKTKKLMDNSRDIELGKKKRLKGLRAFIQEEDGMGTVEIILIIVEIFTLRKYGILC